MKNNTWDLEQQRITPWRSRIRYKKNLKGRGVVGKLGPHRQQEEYSKVGTMDFVAIDMLRDKARPTAIATK